MCVRYGERRLEVGFEAGRFTVVAGISDLLHIIAARFNAKQVTI